MLTRTRLKLKNVESSISFMQNQHAKTLEGLHHEIENLQKKNARLTFEMTMSGCKSGDGHTQSEDLIAEITRLKTSLSKKQEDVDLIQHQLDQLLAKDAEDISLQDQTISQLNCDLEAKACMIALLTQQLYQTRARLKQEIEKSLVCICPHCKVHQRTLTKEQISSGDMGRHIVPHPPSSSLDGSNHSIIRRASTPMRRHPTSPKNPNDCNKDNTHNIYRRSLKPVCASKEPKELPFELQQMLNSKDEEAKLILREAPPVLPPIPSSQNNHGSTTDDQNQMDSSPAGSCHTLHHHHHVPLAYSSTISSPHSRQRRLIMAKSQGLSSAPSTLRVLKYSTKTIQAQDVQGGVAIARGEALENKEGTPALDYPTGNTVTDCNN